MSLAGTLYHVYRPRLLVRLFVPNVGDPQTRTQQEQLDDVTELQVRAYRCTLYNNNLNEADECEISLEYDDAGIDPRFLKSAEVYVHLGNADDNGYFAPSIDNLRFVGIAVDVDRNLEVSSGKEVHIRALDYTSLFIASKPYPASQVPDLNMTLRQAWAKVCDNTGWYDLDSHTLVSTVARLKDRIEFLGDEINGDLVIGSAVSDRLTKIGKLQVHSGSDAWAVWQTCVGSLGLVSYIDGDRCIVSTATDYYTSGDPPRFIWGKNVSRLHERRDVHSLSAKNVGVESFNPLTGRTIESFYPPLNLVQAPKKKRVAASALGPGVSVRAQDYEIFDCPMPITDQGILDRFARRIWEERTRQEMSGTLMTAEMFVDTLNSGSFDLLKLGAGDRVRVEIDQSTLTIIQALPTQQSRIAAMLDRGYSLDMATFVVKNLSGLANVTPEFQVHSVRTHIDTSQGSDGGGLYEVEIHYVNRIDVNGSSQPGHGAPVATITGQKK